MDHNFDFIKLLLDGTSVGAVIIVVIIFLKYAKEYNQSLKDISKDFTDRIEKSQTHFQTQIDRLAENFLNNERSYQTQIQKLFDDFINISRETITAVKELESAVREMKNELMTRKKQ